MRRFIKAMGGELEIVARFPDHNVTIKNFHDLAEECLKQGATNGPAKGQREASKSAVHSQSR